MITKLAQNDVTRAFALLEHVTSDLRNHGINQWDALYPDKVIVQKDINDGHAYGYWKNLNLAGYIALNDEYPSEYDAIKWSIQGKNLIVHRLAVDTPFQRMGIAEMLMNFAYDFAKENDYQSIRLDAYAANTAANALYKKLGYQKTGQITFRTGLFYCYEIGVK